MAAAPKDAAPPANQEDRQAANGRPVGVAIDRTGALLVADDVGNAIWRVSAAAPAAEEPPTQR